MKTYAIIIGALAALTAGVATAQVSVTPGASLAPACVYACGDQPGRYLAVAPPPPAPTPAPAPAPFPPTGPNPPFPVFVLTPGQASCGYAGALGWICVDTQGNVRR